MASETMARRTSGLFDDQRHSSIPSRSSSLTRDTSIRRSRALTRSVAPTEASESRPLPQRSGSSSTSRHRYSSAHVYSPGLVAANSGSTADWTIDLTSDRKKPSDSQKVTPRSASCSAVLRTSMHPTKVQRWAGLTRTVSNWDFIRRDPELWYDDGDCCVHLHTKGASRRGPSFRIPYRILRQKKCSALLEQCEGHVTSTTGIESQRLKRMPSTLKDRNQEPGTMQLFIPAPNETSREDSFRWHITTRNLFALLLGKPLVGEHMGQAFVDVQERLTSYRPKHPGNHREFLDYAENQGYRDLVECTDYALASLFYAEHFKLRDVWIDAFAHCVGMNESLALSPEYTLSSQLTKALITRTYLEVEMHLGRVSSALSKFLKDDLSPTYLGLNAGARNHLDRFRRFLHMYYTEKFGYWPPPRGSSFPKALYKSMYFDFKVLYDYLADTESSTDIASQKPASGGICVLQNVDNFDKRHNFKPQLHPLPLLPAYVPGSKKLDSQKALRQLTLSTQHNKSHNLHSMSSALAGATNILEQDKINSKILQAYMDFERSHALNASQREEKISVGDGRKVRWLLIYGTLQYLMSALRAPKEVRDSESAEYPLCCMTEQSTWSTSSQQATPAVTPSATPSEVADVDVRNSQQSPVYDIQPDCHREDYFSKPRSRRDSIEPSTSTKPATPSRQSSLRAFTQRSLSVRSSRSSRRNSVTLQPTQHCAILVHGYGDGLHEPSAQPSISTSRPGRDAEEPRPDSSWLRSRSPSVRPSSHKRQPSTTDALLPRTPTLDSFQLEDCLNLVMPKLPKDTPTRSDSTGSNTSSVWSQSGSVASSKTSNDSEQSSPSKSNSTVESSGLLGGLVAVGSTVEGISQPAQDAIPQSHIHPLFRKASPPIGFDFSFDAPHADSSIGPNDDNSNPRVGMAFSAPPSPPISDTPITITRADAAALAAEKRTYLPPRSINAEPISVPSKKDRNSYVFPDLHSNELWEHYRNTLTRRQGPSIRLSEDATPPPIAKSVHNLKMPSFRSASKTAAEPEVIKKKESKRLSSFWKR